MRNLGINIDHVATIRNARGENHPDPYKIAKYCINSGANSITIHLREDRRHIRDKDLIKISTDNKIILNLEIAANLEMQKIALKNKPNFICIVPEKRKEITTEGGLNLNKNFKFLKTFIKKFNDNKIRTSLFINPTINNVVKSKLLGSNCIELHTGKISNLIKKNKNYKKELLKIKKVAMYASKLNLEVHAGHGIDFKTAKVLSRIIEIKEFNIGHFIIGESIIFGLKNIIREFKRIIN